MRNFGSSNPNGTVFSPKQWLYEKEATGMESSKMYCPSRCRYRTYQCVAANYPVTWWLCRVLKGNMRNFGPTNPHGIALAPKQWLYEKEATGMESSKMYCPSRCRYRNYQCVAANYPVTWWLCRVLKGNMRNFGPTNPHGIALAPKQWLYEKEATGMESSKMYFPTRYRYRTY